MDKAILFLNGQMPSFLPEMGSESLLICTDGAYNYLKDSHIVPDVVLGDMDSIENLEQIPAGVEVVKTPDQNFTDFEKALKYLCLREVKCVSVYGSSGLHQDHFLGNLNVAFKYKDRLSLKFFDDHGIYFFLDYQSRLKDVNGKTISLIPFLQAKNVVTKGLQYPLSQQDLSLIQNIGVRNKAIQTDVSISFEAGALLVFVLED